MGYKMTRGRQQVLYSYLPGQTFDFEGIATIAKVNKIQGNVYSDLNISILLGKIAEDVRAWLPDFRPVLRDNILQNPTNFVLLNPQKIEAEIFPKIFWCQNRKCGRILDYSQNSESIPSKTCPHCKNESLIQLRFVKIHRCGALHIFKPPICPTCHNNTKISLDSRGSERISNFRWICNSCGASITPFAGFCPDCQWPPDSSGDTSERRMDIEVFRSARTFYPHSATFLNIPDSKFDAFLSNDKWYAVVASKYLKFKETEGRKLIEFIPSSSNTQLVQNSVLTGNELDSLMQKCNSGEMTPAQLVEKMNELHQERVRNNHTHSLEEIEQNLIKYSGVNSNVWQNAGYDLLEAVTLDENSSNINQNVSKEVVSELGKIGVASMSVIADFPIINASYGFSRVDYRPNKCRINPFPQMREYGGKFPIFVDQIQADALVFKLDAEKILRWLTANSYSVKVPIGIDGESSTKSYFVELFNDLNLRESLGSSMPQARMVFGLIHTLCHLCIRQAALLCGLDTTSISEYILPRSLTFALYCNHRFGTTIGALTTLFEQSISEWLNSVYNTRHCVYDPVCKHREGNCHACTHLAETSCRYFNLNLGRAFLFGGKDLLLGDILVGYFDPSL